MYVEYANHKQGLIVTCYPISCCVNDSKPCMLLSELMIHTRDPERHAKYVNNRRYDISHSYEYIILLILL